MDLEPLVVGQDRVDLIRPEPARRGLCFQLLEVQVCVGDEAVDLGAEEWVPLPPGRSRHSPIAAAAAASTLPVGLLVGPRRQARGEDDDDDDDEQEKTCRERNNGLVGGWKGGS